MTLSDFKLLDYQGRISAAHAGVYVAERSCGELIVLLYQLESFYIEVYFHQRLSFVQAIEAFDHTSLLDPYLDEIKVGLGDFFET